MLVVIQRLFWSILGIFQHIMIVFGRNDRTPVEHCEEGMTLRIYNYSNIT